MSETENWAEELVATLKLLGATPLESPGPCARLPVRGGIFRHPLTRAAVDEFVLYGAGPGTVKIVSPRFLWSLPRVKLEGSRPEQFFASVAKQLGEILLGLGQTRSRLLAMGIVVELESDALVLRGQAALATRQTVIAADAGARVTLESIDGRSLAALERAARSVVLGPDSAPNLESLGSLAAKLANLVSAAEEAPVLELTEVIDDTARQSTPPPPPPAEAHSLGALGLNELLEKCGSNARIAAVGGRLRIETTLKVVQGVYGFQLEQQGPSRFVGVLVTPAGQRRQVAFDLAEIIDLKDVLDRYLMGR